MQERNEEKNTYFYSDNFYKTNLVSYYQIERPIVVDVSVSLRRMLKIFFYSLLCVEYNKR